MATKLYNSLTEKPLVGLPSPLLVEKANAVRGKLVGAVREKVGTKTRWQFISTPEITKTRKHVVYVYLPASVLAPRAHAPMTKAERAVRLQRPSPTAHAGDHPGEVKTGHDGKRWRSEADRNGIFHWKKVKGPVMKVGDQVRVHDFHKDSAGKFSEGRTYFGEVVDTSPFRGTEVSLRGGGKVWVKSTSPDAWKRGQMSVTKAASERAAAATGSRTCHACKKPITGTPVSHHSTGKPSKHYHPQHAPAKHAHKQ